MSGVLPPPPPGHAGPPPPAPGMGGAGRGQHLLQRPISDLVNKELSTTFHLCRVATLVPLLRRLTDDRARSEAIPELDLQSIITALVETRYSDPGQKEPAGAPNRATLLGTTIAAFNAKTKAEQYALLNQLWARCYDREIPATPTANMVDAAVAVHPSQGPLPTCLRPVDRTATRAVVQVGPTANAWTAHQIGFRIEGGFRPSKGEPAADLARVMNEGIMPLAQSNALALSLAGKSYLNLDVSSGTHVHLGYQNRDVYNESASCVSRTLLGATAFPYRWSDSTKDGASFRYLFAINCAGLNGLDTEAWQLGQVGVNLWRPGEKAFLNIPKANILAYTGVARAPYAPGVGWKFKFMTAAWRWINRPSQAVQDYLNAELTAWDRDRWYEVPDTYDFQIK